MRTKSPSLACRATFQSFQPARPTCATRRGSRLARSEFAADSPLEEAGFEPSVPRETTKFSTPAHVAVASLRGDRRLQIPDRDRSFSRRKRFPVGRVFQFGSLAVERQELSRSGRHRLTFA